MPDSFKNTSNHGGFKPIRNSDWFDVQNALGNITVGSAGVSAAGEYGMAKGLSIPSDAYFFPHVACVNYGFTEAIIGIDREEDWYPYVDCLTLPFNQNIITFERSFQNEYVFRGDESFKAESEVTYFPEPNKIAVASPSTPGDPVIVGYEFILYPKIVSVQFSDFKMFVTVQWRPPATFATTDEAYAELYTESVGANFSRWGFKTIYQEYETSSLSELINAYLLSLSSPNYPITIPSEQDIVTQQQIKVPVARYDWNNAGTELTRCVQLLFHNVFHGGAPPGATGSEGPDFPHPFKARVKPNNPDTIEVGYLRPGYEDKITIQGPSDDHDYVVDFTAAEDIVLDTVSPYGDYYVYYDIYFDVVADAWVADLEKSETWPPTQDAPGTDQTNTGNIIRLVGVAEWDSSNETYIWQQHMFESPTETPVVPRGYFEAWYVNDGEIRIAPGSVETFNGDSAIITGADISLDVDTDIWVRITSNPSTGDPSVVIDTTLQTGNFPGLYEDVSESVKRFNYKIGEILTGEYIPFQKGAIYVDNTLLSPDIDPLYCSDVDSPRMMVFHDDQVTSVGNILNDKLLDAEFLEMEVVGGGVRHLIEGGAVEFYGLSESLTGEILPTFEGTDGYTWGEGSVAITTKSMDIETTRGLVQTLSVLDDDILTLEAGSNVRIDYSAGTATIVSKGGLTVDDTESLLDVSGVDGSSYGSGSVTIQGKNLEKNFDDGHVQTFTIANGDSLQIVAGTNVQIDYAAGVATISADATGSVSAKNSIEVDVGSLQLVGDEDTPGNNSFYGTEGAGTKGWQDFTQVTYITDIQLDVSNNLQVKTRTGYLWNPGTESAFTTISGWNITSCP